MDEMLTVLTERELAEIAIPDDPISAPFIDIAPAQGFIAPPGYSLAPP